MNDQAPELGKDKDLKDHIYDLHELRRNYEPMAYMARRAYEGKHFVYWNRTQQHLEEVPLRKQFFNQVPEVAKQADAYENFLLTTDFTFTVIPQELDDDDGINDAYGLSLLAKDYHERLKATTMFSDYIHWSLMDNVSFVEVTPNDQKDDVEIRDFNFFDILMNPRIRSWNQQPIVAKIVRKNVKAAKKSKLYHFPKDYQPANAEDFISWQDIYESEKFPNWVKLQQDEMILFECQIPSAEGLTIKTIDAAGTVVRNDHYEYIKRADGMSGMSIIPLRVYSGEWYQPSYVYRQIPLNRTADIIFNRMEDLILTLSKGGYFVQEEEEIDGEMNESVGQIIRYMATKPEQIQMANIPPFLSEWFQNIFTMSDRYGLNSLLSGNLPAKSSGVRASKMIEQLKQLTSQNNAAPIANFKSSVKQILQYVFLFLYEMWDTPHDVIATDLGDKIPQFVSGKWAEAYPDAIAIPNNFKRFDVEVDNALGYTLDERKKTAFQLRQMGLIKDDTLKKLFRLGSSAYVTNADEKGMHESPEFKQLMKMYPDLNPEQKKAVIEVLKLIGQSVGNKPNQAGLADQYMPDALNKQEPKKPKMGGMGDMGSPEGGKKKGGDQANAGQ